MQQRNRLMTAKAKAKAKAIAVVREYRLECMTAFSALGFLLLYIARI